MKKKIKDIDHTMYIPGVIFPVYAWHTSPSKDAVSGVDLSVEEITHTVIKNPLNYLCIYLHVTIKQLTAGDVTCGKVICISCVQSSSSFEVDITQIRNSYAKYTTSTRWEHSTSHLKL